jgi:8-oxo-dGTP diphosphatase
MKKVEDLIAGFQSSCRKRLPVACGIIESDGRVLAARRGVLQNLPLKWEFPGGKIEEHEGPEECLIREIKEEMDVIVSVVRPLPPVSHDYPDFSVTLYPYVCSIVSGAITLNVHREAVWVLPGELPSLDWAEASLPVIDAYLKSLNHPLESSN